MVKDISRFRWLIKALNSDGSTTIRKGGRKAVFIRIIRTTPWEKLYFKVIYGYVKKREEVYNDGEYTNRDKAIQAMEAFIEPELLRETRKEFAIYAARNK